MTHFIYFTEFLFFRNSLDKFRGANDIMNDIIEEINMPHNFSKDSGMETSDSYILCYFIIFGCFSFLFLPTTDPSLFKAALKGQTVGSSSQRLKCPH